jgi:starch-binding outer membrane protein, SusD/RagB family
MEKRSRITLFFLAILCGVLVINFSCSDEFFTEKAGDRITPDQHYKSSIDLQVSMYGAVVLLQDIIPKMIMMDGLRSDMMDVTSNADAYLNEINNQIISVDNPYTQTSAFYKVIININEVLINTDKVAGSDQQADSIFIRDAKANLLGMRAWIYLNLIHLYGDNIPYIEGNLTSLPANLSQKVLSKDVLIDTLINQIIPYIHDNSVGTAYAENQFGGFVNHKAVLGELYLEKNDYSNAVIWLKKACESYDNPAPLYKCDKTYKEVAWSNIFLNAGDQGIENIGVVSFSSDEDQFNPLADWTGHTNSYMVKPTRIIIDSFSSQISVVGLNGDAFRGAGITFNADTLGQIDETTYLTEPYITKYEIPSVESFSTDIIISRAADLHLLMAEAYNRLGDPDSRKYALMLLNDGASKESPKPPPFVRWAANLGIRGRVSIQARTVPPYMTDQDSIMNFVEDIIMAERAMELAFEGKRWFDLVRVANRRGDPAYLADRVAAKFEDPGKAEQIRGILMNPANWYLKR